MASPDSKAPPRMDSSSEEAGKNEEIMLHTSSGKSSFAKRIWDKSGLNAGMLVLMVKFECCSTSNYLKLSIN